MADLSKRIKGGLSVVRNAIREADEAMEAKRLAMEAANPPIKASEAYGKYEGSYLKPIFYDRMKVDLSQGKFGGSGFSSIQLVDPNYANAKAVAGVTDQKMATRILNRNKAVPQGADVIWTPSVGGLEQHKSNSTMFGEFADIFSNQRKNMSAEDIQKLSDRASTMTDNKGRLIFPDGIDLGSRNFRQKVKTYDQRALMADIFAGRGVGGEKGRTVPVEELLEKNLDPNMANAGTLDLGNRLFRLEGDVLDRPDLHSDYRKILTGEDLDVNYLPVPIRDVYSDWEVQKALDLAAQGKNRPVTLMDYTKNDPTVQLTDALLSKMQKAGQKEGGAIDGEDHWLTKVFKKREEEGMADGGVPHMADAGRVVKGAAKAFKKLFSDDVLPAAERDANLAKMLEGSKVKDRLYHGTDKDFSEFKFNPKKSMGTWLTNRPKLASAYSEVSARGGDNSAVYPLYAQIKNPASEKDFMDAQDIAQAQSAAEGWHDHTIRHKQLLLNKGFDGVQLQDGTYIAFEPTQIKSAIGNRGTYDLGDSDINKADGGLLHMADAGKVVGGMGKVFRKLLADDVVNGMRVRKDIPNTSSIGASLSDYSTHGLQEVPMSAFETVGKPRYRNAQERQRTQELARQIQQNKELNPLIVVKDAEGHYILEGGHRFDALRELDIDSFPALMVHDLESLGAVGKAEGGLLHMADAGRVVKGLGKVAKMFVDPSELTPIVKGRTRKFGDEVGGNAIIKETGGNWLGGNVEQALKPLRKTGAEERAYMDFVREQHKNNGGYGDWVTNEVLKDPSSQKISALKTANKYLAEKGMKPLKVEPQEAALNDWVDSNLTNYVKKQMGTADDPVRKLAEEGILHIPVNPQDALDPMRTGLLQHSFKGPAYRAEYGGQQLGQSNLAKDWENAADAAIQPFNVQTIKKLSADSPGSNMYESWMNKVDPNTKVHVAGSRFDARDLGFDHIMDVLRSDVTEGRIRPEQLNKVSMEQAVRRTHEYDQEMAKKMRETQAKVTEGMPTHKDYPDKGYKWIELTEPKDLPNGWSQESSGVYLGPNGERTIINPARQNLESALKYEGDTMGHCVGQYCDDVAGGKSRIYSLRDAKGEPHVTVEVRPHQARSKYETDWFTSQPEEVQDQITQQALAEHNAAKTERTPAEDRFTWGQALSNAIRSHIGEIPPEIIQIKGKGNRAPKEEYLPFVQDFVKGGNWSDVNELRNAGLRDIEHNPRLKEYLNKKGSDVPRYLTENEHQGYADDFLMDTLYPKDETPLPPAEGMAQGGGAFKKIQFMDKGGLATSGGSFSPEELGVSADEIGLSEEQRNTFKRNAPIVTKKIFDETKKTLSDDYDRLKNSDRARAQYAKILAAQAAGSLSDSISFAVSLGLDPLKSVTIDKLLTKPKSRSVLEGPAKAGEKQERVPMFGSIADTMKTSDGYPIGGSEHIIKRAQDAGLMYGKTTPVLDEEGYPLKDSDDEPLQYTSGRFSLPTEIGGAILSGSALSKLGSKTPKIMRKTESGLNSLTAQARYPFQPAMLTMEGVAPDLGTFKGSEWQNYLTKKLIGEENAPVGMEKMGGRKTKKTLGQGLYENKAGEFESNPMVGVSIPFAGNLSTNKKLLADIGTAGRELNQENVAAHRFVPMMTNQPKDATAMIIKGQGGKPLSKEQILGLADRLPGMIVSHSPKAGGMFIAPFKGNNLDYVAAQQAAQEVLGKGAKIQYGKAHPDRDVMYRGDYENMGARPPSTESIEMRKRLKAMDANFPRTPSGLPNKPASSPQTLTSIVRSAP